MAEAAAPTLAQPAEEMNSEAWTQALTLLCNLSVDMPLPGFTLGDALRLQENSVIDSHWRVGRDIPLRVNGKLIASGEFEVVGNHLAVRLTELE
jgi:flagellar motor switch/type III secretory pathway protein FliN